jgi:transcriptional regulator with XRE-family HTH domain
MKIVKVGKTKRKNTRCQKCGAQVTLKQIDEYHLNTVGLPNVWLMNIEGYTCGECKNFSVLIPNYGILMQVICEILIFKNDSYTSQELRFLLKYLGIKGKDLAEKLGTSQKTISFWLNGKTRISPSYGIKLRKHVMECFRNYLIERKNKYKQLTTKIETIVKQLKEKEEANYKKYLQEQARLAVQRKIMEFKLVGDVEVPTYKMPYSKMLVQLRD